MKLNTHLKFLRQDPSAEIFSVLRSKKFGLNSFYWTFINKLVCKIKGVKINRSTKFWGWSYFFRFPTSHIEIGTNCRFNSTDTYNLIGVYRKCIFSTVEPGASLKVGAGCGFSGTVIGCFKSIELGNNIKCGANTLITDSDWHLEDPRSGPIKGIVIGDNVWLGINVVVLKGVTIGENTVIGANSVVTKSIPANVIAAGNPCKVIKPLLPGLFDDL